MSTDVKAGVVYYERQVAANVPKIGFRQDYASKAMQGLSGINVDSSGQLILLAPDGSTQMTVTTAGVTFPNSGQAMNYATGTFGLGSETTTNVLVITNNTALTTGKLFSLSSSATAITGGRLFLSNHTGATGTSAILNEFKSAANDETIILQVTATAALALGAALVVSAASMTTGAAFQATDNTSLTSGILLSLASSATAITGAGRMIYSNHTGATTSTGILNEFVTSASDGTTLFKLTGSSLTTSTSGVFLLAAAGLTTGKLIMAEDNSALTTGMLLSVATSATAQTSASRLIMSNHTGASTSAGAGVLNEFKSAATDGTTIARVTATTTLTGVALHLSTASMATGKIISALAAGITTGALFSSVDNTALTTGQLISIATSATAITGAGRLFLSNHTGATGTSATLNEFKSAATDETIIVAVTATGALATGIGLLMTLSSMTTGTGISIAAAAVTTGSLISATDNTAVTTGNLVSIASSSTAISTGRLVYSNFTGATSSAGTSVLNEFAAGSVTDGTTLAKFTCAGTGIQVNLAHATGVLASAKSVLQVTSSAANASGSAVLYVSGTGTPAGATSYLANFDYTNMTASNNPVCVLIQSIGTAAALKVTSSGATASATGVVWALSTGAIAAGGAVLRVSATGTPASSTSYLALFDYSGATATNNPVAVKVIGVGTASTLLVTTAGATAAASAVLQVTGTGTPGTATSYLALFDYTGMTATNNPVAVLVTSIGTAAALKVTSSGATASAVGVLSVTTSGNIAAGGAVLYVTGAGTPAGATSYLAAFDNSGITATNNPVAVIIKQIGTAAALSITDTGAVAAGAGVLTVAQTGTPTSTGYVAKFDNSGMTATNNPPAIFVNQLGTGAVFSLTAVKQSTHFVKIFTESATGVTLWLSDGNTPNGALSGTAGDICFNGASSRSFYCTGTTNWTASNA